MKTNSQIALALALALFARNLSAADAPVTINDDGAAYTLANGGVTAKVDKRNGNLLG